MNDSDLEEEFNFLKGSSDVVEICFYPVHLFYK